MSGFPKDLQSQPERQFGDSAQAAKEALTIEGFRTGKLSAGQVGAILRMGARREEPWRKERVRLNPVEKDLDDGWNSHFTLFPVLHS